MLLHCAVRREPVTSGLIERQHELVVWITQTGYVNLGACRHIHTAAAAATGTGDASRVDISFADIQRMRTD